MNNWAGKLTIGLGWVYYCGPIGHTDFHQHYAVQICFPFTGALQIETPEAKRTVETILVIGSNVSHRLSSPSPTAQLLYIEPTLVAKNISRLNVSGIDELVLSCSKLESLQAKLNVSTAQMQTDFGREITDLLWPQELGEIGNAAFSAIDPRISKTLSGIAAADNLNISLERLALNSGLSPSRFRHLFRDDVGMSVKKYLLWCKLQRAFQCLATDGSLTRAAHAAGFSDSAHLSRTFKRMFGLAPVALNKNAQFTTRNFEF